MGKLTGAAKKLGSKGGRATAKLRKQGKYQYRVHRGRHYRGGSYRG
jgi:hypothetical protein